MNFKFLDSIIRRIRVAVYDVVMATAFLLLYWSGSAALKLYDVAWRLGKVVDRVIIRKTRAQPLTKTM